ncbi:MAG: DUF4373 domain-containing protein [Anaerovoracaceae bacterium]
MARGIKEGVDYFPHDVNASDKKTLYILESKFGNDGYAFWFKLLEILGEKKNHSFDCNDESEWLFLMAKTHVNEISVTEILGMLAKVEAIDPELWQNRIIWSQNFVDRLAPVYKKRGSQLPLKPSFCNGNKTNQLVSVPEIEARADNSHQPVTEMQQSRVEYSKVNKSREIYMPASDEASDCAKQQAEECAKTASEVSSSALTVGKLVGDYPDAFEKFWSHYPKKTEKKAALKCWKARIKAGTSSDDMTKAVLNYVDYIQKNNTPEQYIKQAKTFIGTNEPYLDYLAPVVTPENKASPVDEVDEWLKRKRDEDDT